MSIPPPRAAAAVVDLSCLPRVHAVLSDGVRRGLHSGGQIAVARPDGTPLVDVAFGAAGPSDAAAPMTTNAIMPWWSTAKPILSVLTGIAIDVGAIRSFEDPVSAHLPEFARGGDDGKAKITVADVLTHTAGLMSAGLGAAEGLGNGASAAEVWDATVAATCAADPEWRPPGAKCGYSVGGAFHAVAEGTLRALRAARGSNAEKRSGPARYSELDRITQCSLESYSAATRELIFEPLGMHNSWVGMPLDVIERCRSEGQIGATYGVRKGYRGIIELAPVDDGSASVASLLHDDPSMGGRGPANELVKLFAMLLRDSRNRISANGTGMLSIKSACTISRPRHRSMYDLVQRATLNVGLGMYIDPTFAGRHCSPSTFGHGGSRCAFAYADPEKDVAVAVLFNGRPSSAEHYDRAERLSTALYEDLCLAEPDLDLPRRHGLPGL